MSAQTLLVVDDDHELIRLLQENMSTLGDHYQVKNLDDGEKTVQTIIHEKPDLVILYLQVPGCSGQKILTELRNLGEWTPIIAVTDVGCSNGDTILREYGIVDLLKKPFLVEDLVVRIDNIMRNLANKDVIKNISLPSILQLIEMEKRTGILTIGIHNQNSRVFFKDGRLMDIEVKGLSTLSALDEFINSMYEDREMSIQYIDHRKGKKIDMTLMEMVMEASRLKDEKKKNFKTPEAHKGILLTNPGDLARITAALDSLKEVKRYIIANEHGDVLLASPKEDSEEVLNSSVYLWLIGNTSGNDLRMGAPGNLMCHFKTGKRLIRRYKDLIMIIDLTEIARLSTFKTKLDIL